MDLERAIEHALDGKALLFMGAGFSRGATNLRNGPFKTGSQLAGHIGKAVGLAAGTPLDDASEEFLHRFGPARLIEEVRHEFTTSKVSKAHLQFAQIPWQRIYTTNYDNVLEYSYAQTHRPLRAVTLSERITDIPKDSPWCVHLNGFVDRLTISNASSELKLTDTSYLTATLADSPWATIFREDISLTKAAFFVGYSMADLDIKRLLFERPELKEKCFFILGEQPPPSAVSRAKRFGTILEFDTDKLANRLAAKAKSYTPTKDSGPVPYCLERFEITANSGHFTDRVIFDLMLWGSTKPELVWKGFHGGPRYIQSRQAATTIFGRIRAGVGGVVVHSDLGNGKSILLEEIKSLAKDAGYAVYTFLRKGDSLHEEIDWALRSEDKTLFIVDSYPDWLDSLKLYARQGAARSRIVLAARSSAHDVLVERLSEILNNTSIEEFAADKLSRSELEGIVDYFDEYGLWGELAGWTRTAKLDYLMRVCHSQWHAILIKRFESPQIQAKLALVFKDLREQKNYYQALITILVFAVLGRNPSFDDLVDFCGQPVLETAFRRDPAIKEVVDFAAGEVRLRSSITGQFLLKSVVDPNATVQVLVSMAKTADKLATISTQSFDLLKALSRFSNLQGFFPEKGKSAAILR